MYDWHLIHGKWYSRKVLQLQQHRPTRPTRSVATVLMLLVVVLVQVQVSIYAIIWMVWQHGRRCCQWFVSWHWNKHPYVPPYQQYDDILTIYPSLSMNQATTQSDIRAGHWFRIALCYVIGIQYWYTWCHEIWHLDGLNGTNSNVSSQSQTHLHDGIMILPIDAW